MSQSRPRKAWRAAALLLLACAGCGARSAFADDICGRFAKPPEQPNSAEVGAVLDEFLKIPDAPTVITSIESVPAAGSLPAYCRFKGTTAPQINFELRLPVEWNGKFLMQGCGGMCGWLNMGATEDSLEKRYAVVNTDMGHADPPAVAIWAYDNRSAELDFAYRSTWTTAVVSKRIAEVFYGNAPKRSYFNGCSTGGRQGMIAAQRFPELFDGIISGRTGAEPDRHRHAAPAVVGARQRRRRRQADPQHREAEARARGRGRRLRPHGRRRRRRDPGPASLQFPARGAGLRTQWRAGRPPPARPA